MLQYQLLHRLDRAVSPCCPTTASSTTRSAPGMLGFQDSLEQSLPTEQLVELIRHSTIERAQKHQSSTQRLGLPPDTVATYQSPSRSLLRCVHTDRHRGRHRDREDNGLYENVQKCSHIQKLLAVEFHVVGISLRVGLDQCE